MCYLQTGRTSCRDVREADEYDDLYAAADEAWGTDDAESIDLDVQIEDIQKVED